jgi:uncharacterized protein DUF5926/SEC-C motif-containing protein
MASSSRRRTATRPARATRSARSTESVPVVGPREPCPCGSGKRYKMCHGRGAADPAALVRRPFAGLPGEADWVALREIVPAATAPLTLRPEFGPPTEAMAATVLPLAWPGLHRADGQVWLGLQAAGASGDPSRDLADALLRAIAAEPGSPVSPVDLARPGPRLQDVLVLDEPLAVTVHEGFDFWIADADTAALDAEVKDSLERANSAVVPTARLTSVEAAYWCRVGERTHLRWVMTAEEESLLDALARLHAAGADRLGEAGRYVGAFRAHGLLVPVWDLDRDAVAADVEAPAAAFEQAVAEALARTEPLTADERRARAGVVSRQVTLR